MTWVPACRRAMIVLVAGMLTAPAAHAQFFSRRTLPDPPSQELTAEFLVGDSGGLEPRKGTAWKVHYAPACTAGCTSQVPGTRGTCRRTGSRFWPTPVSPNCSCRTTSPARFATSTSRALPSPWPRCARRTPAPAERLLPPFAGDSYPTVVREYRDRGVVWKDNVHGVRRGKELVIWGAIDAANYMYILSYGFHDDGTISFRVGATGQNLPGHRGESHMHNAHWRIDIDLIDGKKNSAMVMRHVEDPASLTAEDVEEPFNRGFEGGIDWDPKEFTMVRIESNRKNARGKTIGYDLMPVRMGSARHNEGFTQHDFWVTQAHPERPLEYLYSNLPALVKDEEPVELADIVLWATSSSHHEPRDEDGKPDSAPRIWPGDDAWEGSALVMWSGFDLRPRNFFDRTPFYPYPPSPQAARPGPAIDVGQQGSARE